ncbi:MAG: A/G-specific adenine glycosylase [Candidatus Paceibacterota bacterium]
MQIDEFHNLIWDFYRSNKRSLPWRETKDSYKILVSEVMLQQTQVDRVIPKYLSWIETFSDTTKLASASLKEVLNEWKGLGYNRRGLYLKQAAEKIVSEYDGAFPQDERSLRSLPGVGPYTAGAIQAFAWNKPVIFIETNIRTVFIHHFFSKKEKVHDKDILEYIEKTLPKKRAREWYWALMDYGAHLKQTLPNPSRRSKHHVIQEGFKGSNREVRSRILSFVLENGPVKREGILQQIQSRKWSVEDNIDTLTNEGLIKKSEGLYSVES